MMKKNKEIIVGVILIIITLFFLGEIISNIRETDKFEFVIENNFEKVETFFEQYDMKVEIINEYNEKYLKVICDSEIYVFSVVLRELYTIDKEIYNEEPVGSLSITVKGNNRAQVCLDYLYGGTFACDYQLPYFDELIPTPYDYLDGDVQIMKTVTIEELASLYEKGLYIRDLLDLFCSEL